MIEETEKLKSTAADKVGSACPSQFIFKCRTVSPKRIIVFDYEFLSSPQ